MSELDQQPAGGISRRTVTKAMAWSIPAIAIAVPAPAFAASGGTLTLGGTGCKLPGNSNSVYKGYAFDLSASNTTNSPVTINITSATLDGAPLGGVAIINLDTGVLATNPFTMAPDTQYPNLALVTSLAPNSQNGVLVIQYTVNGGTTQTLTATVPSVAPLNGASCSAFTPAQKVTINQALGGAAAWIPNHAYAVGDAVSVNGATYVATVAGTSGATFPTPNPAIGGTVVDGTVTWQRVA